MDLLDEEKRRISGTICRNSPFSKSGYLYTRRYILMSSIDFKYDKSTRGEMKRSADWHYD
jgi:hypothetical protein